MLHFPVLFPAACDTSQLHRDNVHGRLEPRRLSRLVWNSCLASYDIYASVVSPLGSRYQARKPDRVSCALFDRRIPGPQISLFCGPGSSVLLSPSSLRTSADMDETALADVHWLFEEKDTTTPSNTIQMAWFAGWFCRLLWRPLDQRSQVSMATILAMEHKGPVGPGKHLGSKEDT
jgi:hypothetical protein